MEEVNLQDGECGMINYKNVLNITNDVYGCLQDDVSRDIYKARVMNSLTYDYNYITKITVNNIDVMDKLRKDIEPYIKEGKKLILDGAGYYGKSIKMTLKDIKFECFSDRNSQENLVMGIPVLSRKNAVEKYPDALFIVDSMVYARPIKAELEQLGVEHILDFGSYLGKNGKALDNQYYDVFKFSDNEVIADVGCFDCYTMMQYFKYGNTKYKKIYSFEPEPQQYMHCKKIIEKDGCKNWDIYNYGVYDDNAKLYFSSNSSSTKVSKDGDIEVDVIKLDDFFKTHETPTFIKMDIEGAELAALKGCADTIREYKPKLAICVYHKPEDIFEIPEYILSLNPNYKMWLRHYTNLINETVLYCE